MGSLDGNQEIIIVGAGGHGKVVAECCKRAGRHVRGFIDDDGKLTRRIDGVPILGDTSLLVDTAFLEGVEIIVGIGNCDTRLNLTYQIMGRGGRLATIIDPSAVVSSFASIGRGTVLVTGSIIHTGTRIGDGVIVNTGATVDHDNVVEDGVHIGPGAHLAGNVTCRLCCDVGTGSCIIPGVTIGSKSVVAAGAVVVRDVDADCLVAGCPAELIRRLG